MAVPQKGTAIKHNFIMVRFLILIPNCSQFHPQYLATRL